MVNGIHSYMTLSTHADNVFISKSKKTEIIIKGLEYFDVIINK